MEVFSDAFVYDNLHLLTGRHCYTESCQTTAKIRMVEDRAKMQQEETKWI